MTSASGTGLNKVYESASSAIAGLSNGASLLVGGFLGHGEPESLLRAVVASGATDLTIITGSAGDSHSRITELNALVESGCVRKLVSPMPFDPRHGGPVKDRWQAGDLELEVLPVGVPDRAHSRWRRRHRRYVPAQRRGHSLRRGERVARNRRPPSRLSGALKADFALLRASAADTLGNLVYSGTQRNWNPVMAMAARVTVAEVDEIREPGGLDPERVMTPAIFVQRMVLAG